MTDNEIIKTLECRIDNFSKSVLDLINRKNAEIERSEKELMQCKLEKEMMYQTVEEIKSATIKEFAERLKEYELCMFCSFPNNRSLGCEQYIVLSDYIDNLVKEMTEE